MKIFKKILFSFALVLTLSLSFITFTGCKNKKASVNVNNVFAMSMVSASNCLENKTSAKSATVSDQTKDTLKQYTEMFEGMLNHGIHPTESNTTEADQEYSTYTKKLSLTLDNEIYTMYFNEVFEGTETEIDDEEVETTTTTFLYGKVVKVVNNEKFEYNVVGSREIESENKRNVVTEEKELELIFTTDTLNVSNTKSIDNININTLSDYVMVEQETEEGEIEFEYTTKINGSVKSVEIEFENKNGKEKLEIEIVENNVKTKYDIKKVSDNKYSVKLKKDSKKTIFYIEKVDENFVVVNA